MSGHKDGPQPENWGTEAGNRSRYDNNIPETRGPVDPSLRAIAKAGQDDLDLAMDGDGRWWPVSPIISVSKRIAAYLDHSAAFWLINALSMRMADAWQEGKLTPAELDEIRTWLEDCSSRDPRCARRHRVHPAAEVRHE